MPKKTIAKIGYGSFDQVDRQSLDDYNFLFFILLLFCDCIF
jgi:hypothetical protein